MPRPCKLWLANCYFAHDSLGSPPCYHSGTRHPVLLFGKIPSTTEQISLRLPRFRRTHNRSVHCGFFDFMAKDSVTGHPRIFVNSLSRIPPSRAEQPPHGNSLFYWVSPNSRSEPYQQGLRKSSLVPFSPTDETWCLTRCAAWRYVAS
jgi:hypothetical protein